MTLPPTSASSPGPGQVSASAMTTSTALPHQRKWLIPAAAIVVVLGAIAAALLSQPGQTIDFPASPANLAPSSEFAFLDMGSTTVLSRQLRRRLEDALGADAIAFRTPVDLSFSFRELLPARWPHLAALDAALNPPLGERREHNTIKLMYRRAAQQNTTLEYVELLFSNLDGRPLIFYVKAGAGGRDLVAALEGKHGAPEVLPGSGGDARGWAWRQGDDLLVALVSRDKAGRPSYHIIFYYADNLRNLVAHETSARDAAPRREGGGVF